MNRPSAHLSLRARARRAGFCTAFGVVVGTVLFTAAGMPVWGGVLVGLGVSGVVMLPVVLLGLQPLPSRATMRSTGAPPAGRSGFDHAAASRPPDPTFDPFAPYDLGDAQDGPRYPTDAELGLAAPAPTFAPPARTAGPGTRTYRRAVRRPAAGWYLVLLVAVVAVCAVGLAATADGVIAATLWSLAALLAVLQDLGMFLVLISSVSVSSRGLRLRALGTRDLPWAEVTAIRIRPRGRIGSDGRPLGYGLSVMMRSGRTRPVLAVAGRKDEVGRVAAELLAFAPGGVALVPPDGAP